MHDAGLSYTNLLRHLKTNAEGFKKLDIALIGEFATQHYAKALQAALRRESINSNIWEADYNSVDISFLDKDSPLYDKQYHYVIIVTSVSLLKKQHTKQSAVESFANDIVQKWETFFSHLTSTSNCRIIITNYPELNDGIFGNYANKLQSSFLYQLRAVNLGLMNLAIRNPAVFISDAQLLLSQEGYRFGVDPKLYIHADIAYSLDFLGRLAINTSRLIGALEGNIAKCIICDLDNTLWGGIIGDDGLENIEIGELGIGKAFTQLQSWLLELKNRGIILAVCSKNNDETAREVFEKHPSMILRMSDISVFVANWETKVDNIIFIQSVLNIGFDSMIFLDDNPFERDMVRQHIPAICVPELPEDPAEYLSYLQSLNLFETGSVSGEDSIRTQQYQQEANRAVLQKQFANEDDFLSSLGMKAMLGPFDVYSIPRIAQLTQRSNQFNLRTIRYSEGMLRQCLDDTAYKTVCVSLADKYGDYGLISAAILHLRDSNEIFIDTWIMSCRVLKRGVETLLLKEIVKIADENNRQIIVGEYIPTAKNSLVRDLYPRLGFVSDGMPGRFILNRASYRSEPVFIETIYNYANS